MRAPLDLCRELGIGKRQQARRPRPGRPRRPGLSAAPGSGTSVNGPVSVWNSVEVSSCGRAVREIEGQRGLRIAAPFGLDAGGRAAERAAAVGADRRAAPTPRPPPLSLTETSAVADLDRLGVVLDQRERRNVARARCRARPAGAGSRCCSRRPRVRSRSPRSRPPARAAAARVSSTIRMTPQRRRLVRAALPDAERVERRDRASRAARWCGCRPRGRARRPGPSRRRLPPARSRRSGRPGRRRRPRPRL